MASYPATPAQVGYLNALLAERDWTRLQVGNITEALERGLTKTEASTLISLVKDCPKRVTVAFTASKATEGFYVYGDSVYRVQKSKSTGNLYAKILVTSVYGKANWEYAPGMVSKLTEAVKLTLEVAASMGHRYGVCMVCGRTLTAEDSVEAGIGPICSGRI